MKKNNKLYGKNLVRFVINSTRISTFVCFTDNQHMIILDRENLNLQRVINNRYDCFGAVTFENATMSLKLDDSKDFFNSKIINMELIPGFAYEDNLNNTIPETVIMFGYIINLSSEDLSRAITNKTPSVKLMKIKDSSYSDNVLTSKLRLAKHYLIKREE